MAYTAPERLRKPHDLSAFDCGDPRLDEWLARRARLADSTGSARVFVALAEGGRVAGYYAIATGSVDPADATARMLKGQPSDRPIPTVLLARLAVARQDQGRGLGRSLLFDAMLRCEAAADHIGLRGLTVHAANDQACRFYLRFGFEESVSDRSHLILLMKDLRKFLDQHR